MTVICFMICNIICYFLGNIKLDQEVERVVWNEIFWIDRSFVIGHWKIIIFHFNAILLIPAGGFADVGSI